MQSHLTARAIPLPAGAFLYVAYFGLIFLDLEEKTRAT